MNYYFKYNPKGTFPWELWYGPKRLDCFVTKAACEEKVDFMNEVVAMGLKLNWGTK